MLALGRPAGRSPCRRPCPTDGPGRRRGTSRGRRPPRRRRCRSTPTCPCSTPGSSTGRSRRRPRGAGRQVVPPDACIRRSREGGSAGASRDPLGCRRRCASTRDCPGGAAPPRCRSQVVEVRPGRIESVAVQSGSDEFRTSFHCRPFRYGPCVPEGPGRSRRRARVRDRPRLARIGEVHRLRFVGRRPLSWIRMNWNALLRLLQCSSTHCGPSGIAGDGGDGNGRGPWAVDS